MVAAYLLHGGGFEVKSATALGVDGRKDDGLAIGEAQEEQVGQPVFAPIPEPQGLPRVVLVVVGDPALTVVGGKGFVDRFGIEKCGDETAAEACSP